MLTEAERATMPKAKNLRILLTPNLNMKTENSTEFNGN
jgi:hypothetical protein